MIKKLSKLGNSLSILIDKPILELIDANENTLFKIEIKDGKIILEPVRPSESEFLTISENKKLQKKYEEMMKKYDAVFEKLAKN